MADAHMISSSSEGAIVNVRVIPRSGRSGIAGIRNDAVLIRLNAPPVDGAANTELIRVMAEILEIPRRDVEIVSGERSRGKRVRIRGVEASDVRRRLLQPSP